MCLILENQLLSSNVIDFSNEKPVPKVEYFNEVSEKLRRILDSSIEIDFWDHFIKRVLENLPDVSEEEIKEGQIKSLENMLDLIIEDLIHNSTSWILSLEHKHGRIKINIYYNEQKNTLTIIVSDNGAWKNAYNTQQKKESWGSHPWWHGIFQKIIQRIHFIIKYQRYLWDNGAVVKVVFDLNKLQDYSTYPTIEDRFMTN